MNKDSTIEGLILLFFAPFIYLFTIYPQTRPYSFHAFIICLVFLLSLYLFKRHERLYIKYLSVATVLFLVGTTGWFNSPFFYLIYLVAVSLAFLYEPLIPNFFIAIFVLFYLPNIGQIDHILDSMKVISLLLLIPLSYFLRKNYLVLKENEKKILILQEDQKKFKNKVSEQLSNKITRFSINLKEPVNDIKQIAHLMKKKSDDKSIDRIIYLTGTIIDKLKDFEQKTTGKKLVES